MTGVLDRLTRRADGTPPVTIAALMPDDSLAPLPADPALSQQFRDKKARLATLQRREQERQAAALIRLRELRQQLDATEARVELGEATVEDVRRVRVELSEATAATQDAGARERQAIESALETIKERTRADQELRNRERAREVDRRLTQADAIVARISRELARAEECRDALKALQDTYRGLQPKRRMYRRAGEPHPNAIGSTP